MFSTWPSVRNFVRCHILDKIIGKRMSDFAANCHSSPRTGDLTIDFGVRRSEVKVRGQRSMSHDAEAGSGIVLDPFVRVSILVFI